MNKILITGGGGLVGSSLSNYINTNQKEDDKKILLNRNDCNLCEKEQVRGLFNDFKPTHVYHLAASVYGIGGNIAYPADIFSNNTLINTHVIDACLEFNVKKVVAMGTAAIYSDGLTQPICEEDALYGLPHCSELAYAYSKRAMLIHLQACRQQFGLEYGFAIATNMYGPNDKFDTVNGHVVPSLLLKFLEAEKTGNVVTIWGDGSPTRDFLYSDDASKGLTLIMNRGIGSFNLAYGRSFSISKLVDNISMYFPSVKYTWDITKPLGQLIRSYNINSLQSIGFKPDFDLSLGLYKTIEWLRGSLAVIRK